MICDTSMYMYMYTDKLKLRDVLNDVSLLILGKLLLKYAYFPSGIGSRM